MHPKKRRRRDSLHANHCESHYAQRTLPERGLPPLLSKPPQQKEAECSTKAGRERANCYCVQKEVAKMVMYTVPGGIHWRCADGSIRLCVFLSVVQRSTVNAPRRSSLVSHRPLLCSLLKRMKDLRHALPAAQLKESV